MRQQTKHSCLQWPLILCVLAIISCVQEQPKPAVPDRKPAPPVRTPFEIIDRPIQYDDKRIEHTITYRRAHQKPGAPGVESISIDPRILVLHYTDSISLDDTWRYFNRPTVEGRRELLAEAGEVNVSTHFLVDRDGTVYRLMPETWFARHCIGLNHVAIGIENIGSATDPLTEAQVQANAELIRYLAARYPRLTHLIGHMEYRAMQSHPYFDERDPTYRTDKADPGDAFLARVRKLVADLDLQGPPAG